MSYKFNNGNGAVLCDCCNIMIDAYLSLIDYKKIYQTDNYCWRCHESIQGIISGNPCISVPDAAKMRTKDLMAERIAETSTMFSITG